MKNKMTNSIEAEEFFKAMFFDIWQGHHLEKLDDYYAENFTETIYSANDLKEPVTLTLGYEELAKQAAWQKEYCKQTTLAVKKVVLGSDNHITVSFYSTSICKKTDELRHRWVCGIWHLNSGEKIDRVWAVVTPLYE